MQKKQDHPNSGIGSYSGLAFQMGIIIFLGAYGGIKLDNYLNSSPCITLIGVLGSLALSIYFILKTVLHKK